MLLNSLKQTFVNTRNYIAHQCVCWCVFMRVVSIALRVDVVGVCMCVCATEDMLEVVGLVCLSVCWMCF